MTEDANCPNCGGPIAIRNPTGKCDHLYYPENVPGYVSERSALLRCEEALRSVIDATRAYLPPDGISKLECINRVLMAADNAEIVAALTLLDEARNGK